MVVTAIITSAVIIVMLTLAYSGANARDEQRNDQLAIVAQTLVATNQAIACELALPVTDTGRDPELVKACFTQYGLQAPGTLNP
jgi:hypothetical protein